MGRNFEVFEHRRLTATDMPRVTLGAGGVLRLNDVAYRLIGGPEALILLYEKESQTVALRPAKRGEAHSYAVRKTRNGNSFVIGIPAFCNHYGIDYSRARAFAAAKEDGLLVFQISRGLESARLKSGRAKRGG